VGEAVFKYFSKNSNDSFLNLAIKGMIFVLLNKLKIDVKVMIFYKLHYLFLICFGLILNAQEKPNTEMLIDEYGKEYYYDIVLKAKVYEIDGERIVIMDELYLGAKPKFNNQLDRNYYFFLNKKLSRVYPLFFTALEQYRSLQADIQNMKGGEKRKHIREKQKELASQYETKLRDLTTSEGQIFAKLMNRSTGKTVYELIKELKGGFNAFLWNVKGNVADIDLKKEYNPHKYRDDEYLESLLISNWKQGYLKPYAGYEKFTIKGKE